MANESDPRDNGTMCDRCGTRYQVDLMVSDEIWAAICGDDVLLCGPCIVNALPVVDGKVVEYCMLQPHYPVTRATQPATAPGDYNWKQSPLANTSDAWKHWFDRLGKRVDAELVNATARLVLAEMPERTASPPDGRFMVHEPTSTVQCNDSRCPVGATINGWPHPFGTPDCLYAATVATPTDVAERARRAVQQLREANILLADPTEAELAEATDIIAEEFR